MSIEVKNLVKFFNDRCVLDDISFSINAGEIVGFLGPNGAGKSTTMRILTGFLSYDDGSVKIDNDEVFDNHLLIKRKIGYVPEQPALYKEMTVKKYLEFISQMKEVPLFDRNREVHKVMEMARITEVSHRIIGRLSKGFRQRIGLAQALIADPKILIFDEPTEGLDPSQIRDIRHLIRELATDRTVILSSHILSEVEATCDRVLIINKGKIVAADKIANISKQTKDYDVVFLELDAPRETVINTFNSFENLHVQETADVEGTNRFEISITGSREIDLRALLFKECAKNNWVIYRMQLEHSNLEDIFINLTKEGC